MGLLHNWIRSKAAAAASGLSARQRGPPGGRPPPGFCRNCFIALRTSGNIGKVPALCAPNGPSLTNYTACVACSEEQSRIGNSNGNGGGGGGRGPWRPPSDLTTGNATSPAYLNPVFGQYLGYCNVSEVQVAYTVTATPTDGGATASPAPSVVTTDITLPHDFTAAAAAVSQTGPAATSTTVPAAGAANTGSGDRGWIAGPIVGAIVGTAVVVLAIVFVLYRQRKARRAINAAGGGPNSKSDGAADAAPEVGAPPENQQSGWKNELEAQQVEKAQLHSESVAPRTTPHKLDGGGERRGDAYPESNAEGTYAELPAHHHHHRHDLDTTTNSQGRSPRELAGEEQERMGVVGHRSELA